MLRKTNQNSQIGWAAILILVAFSAGCARLRLPAIDPTGERIFLPAPNSTTFLTPGTVNPLRGRLGEPPPVVTFPIEENVPQVAQNQQPVIAGPLIRTPSSIDPNYPVTPAFTHPPDPECCDRPGHGHHHSRKHMIPNPRGLKSRGKRGEIITTPHRIIAPVGSEVVVLAGICGGDGHFVLNQPLEWMLSNDSVGQFIEVGGMNHSTFNRWVPPQAKKIDGQYAWGRTGLKNLILTRGTPIPVDDIELLKGQTFISLSSESGGTSYVTAVAPKAEAWDKRRAATIIHWVDGIWSIPTPTVATAGTVHPMTTLITKSTTGKGLPGWKVRYSIVGGSPAEFAPAGSQTAEAISDANGQATVQLRQQAGQFDPGTTQVRVEVIRPELYGEPELTVESGVTTVTWSAPALTIRAIGPRSAGVEQPFNYRVEVTNPGDQIARDVVVRTKDLGNDVDFISSTPKPTEYGRQFEWQLGDIAPGAPAKVIDIQLKSSQRGNVGLCFEVESETDQLATDACAQTEITVPCVGLTMEGPEQARVGDEINFNIIVENQCDEPLRNIELVVQYDTTLDPLAELGNPIQYRIETLAFGEKREVPLTFIPRAPGTRCFDLSITADDGHTARAKECVEVSQVTESKVSLDVQGTQLTEAGAKALVRTIITNSGNVAIDDITLTNRFSDSLTPKNISIAYPQYWLGNDMAFTIGRLEPGQEAMVEVVFDAVSEDGNAFSEMTISNPDGNVSATQRVDIRIEPRGSSVAPNIDVGAQPPRTDEDPIRIRGDNRQPADGLQSNLRVNVRSLNRTVNANSEVTFEFTVSNESAEPDQNVAIRLLAPLGLRILRFDYRETNLPIVKTSDDYTVLDVQPRTELRPGESLKFRAIFLAAQPGQSTLEVQATSSRNPIAVNGTGTVIVQ